MNREEAIKWLKAIEKKYIHGGDEEYDNLRKIALHMAMESLRQPTQSNASNVLNALDTIYRQAAIDAFDGIKVDEIDCTEYDIGYNDGIDFAVSKLSVLPSVQPENNKYEYHYDHTDCIWYRPEARNRCPVTCAQYRDGWNDAMNYIFRDGKGYRPYRRDEQYGQ